ncbi:MAG: DUF2254 domain-containing protein [Hyphomicrobiaceae bacterium]
MLTKWQWMMRQLSRRLWVRATLLGALGILTAALAALVENVLPWEVSGQIGSAAVGDLLGIIATSMLAVTTFSLSVMTSAYSAATSSATPRATKLLMQDQITQNVLATFIGSFLFALVGIILLKTDLYGDRGRVVLFVATIGILVLVVASLLTWIDQLAQLGRVGETTTRVEDATKEAIEARLAAPYFRARPLDPDSDAAKGANALMASVTGYVQHIDIERLSEIAEDSEVQIYLWVLPGTFVHPARRLVGISDYGQVDGALSEDIRACFDIGPERSFDQDPRFGLAVLSEIAIRALSPAVNDPGTAIDVIGRLTRLLVIWADASQRSDEHDIAFPRLHVPALETRDLFDDAFNLIARDGAHMIEVQLRLQKALGALGQLGDEDFRTCARTQAQLALARAEESMVSAQDKTRLRDAAR